MHLIIGSGDDPASTSMSSHLLDNYDFRESEEYPGFLEHGEFLFHKIEIKHLYYDSLESEIKDAGLQIDDIIFLSKHSSVADIKSLTVHPEGNFQDAKLGGKERTLSMSSPMWMSSALRKLKDTYSGDSFEITFEATHHGPYLRTPSYYIEIGTTENEWSDPGALESVTEAVMHSESNSYENFVGVGGGHYMPKITQYVYENSLNVGHMISKHNHDFITKEQVVESIEKTPNCKGFILDHKGTKGRVRSMVKELAESMNMEIIKL